MSIGEYRPTGPWVLQSGKNEDQALEQLMIRKYATVLWFLRKRNEGWERGGRRSKDRFHQHLEWLVKQGESRIPICPCPHCPKDNPNTITRFSVIGDPRGNQISCGMSFTACDREECKRKVDDQTTKNNNSWYRFKFSVLNEFSKSNQTLLLRTVLRPGFGIDKRMSKQDLFEFFAAENHIAA